MLHHALYLISNSRPRASFKMSVCLSAALLVSACETPSFSLDALSFPTASSSSRSQERTAQQDLAEPTFSLCQLCLIGPNGQRLAETNEALRGSVERLIQQSDSIMLEGWAADIQTGKPAETIVAFVGRTLVAQSTPNLPRPALAQSYGLPDMAESGFQLTISNSLLSQGQTEILIYAVDENGFASALSTSNP